MSPIPDALVGPLASGRGRGQRRTGQQDPETGWGRALRPRLLPDTGERGDGASGS